jgi:PKD repeat protein
MISIHSNDLFHPDKYLSFILSVDSNPCIDFSFTADTCSGKINFISSSINTPAYYHWDFGDGDSSDVADPSHSYLTNGNFSVTLIACNSEGCDTISKNVVAMNSGPLPADCIPLTQAYCCGIGITHFLITSPAGNVLDNTSGDAIGGYENFSCISGQMFTNNPYEINSTTSTLFAEYLKVWIDLNNDGHLDSVSELMYSDLDTIAPLHSGNFTIPAFPGNVYGVPLRLRVASDFQQSPEPCTNPHYGQDEDYSIILNFAVNTSEENSAEKLEIYPNPFSNSTTLNYSLKQTSDVSLGVYNILGEKIISLVNSQQQTPGSFNYHFKTGEKGIYLIRLTVNDNIYLKTIISN